MLDCYSCLRAGVKRIRESLDRCILLNNSKCETYFSTSLSHLISRQKVPNSGPGVNFDDGLDVTEGWVPSTRGWQREGSIWSLSVSRKTMDKESPQNLIFTLRPGQVSKQRNTHSAISILS